MLPFRLEFLVFPLLIPNVMIKTYRSIGMKLFYILSHIKGRSQAEGLQERGAYEKTTGLNEEELSEYYIMRSGRDSSVGIATRYGLDGPGIESRWGVTFSAPVQTGPGTHPASCTMSTASFLGGKAAGELC